ncbi:MAG TPA: ABC transporter permease [Gaiellaceae bacterium]|nr:ABC transporter permease [Gaiellaceae bacterium]
MRLALTHARLHTLELIRFPGFTIATLGFPAMLFALFGLPRAGAHPEVLLAAYAAFSVLGVGFYQFGVSAAIERATPWAVFLRTLPASAGVRLAGRVLPAFLFAAVAGGTVIVLALFTTSASLRAGEWVRLVLVLFVGGLPFVLLGTAIAYWLSPKTALPAANIVYMLFAYAGGLWTGPRDLPHALARVSPYVPTRQWGDLLWAAVGGAPLRASHWLALIAYAAIFTAIAAWGYRRDEGQRFR